VEIKPGFLHKKVLFLLLALFALTLPLSKSVSAILLGLVSLYLLGTAFLNRHLREELRAGLKGPLVLPLFLYTAVLALGLLISEDLMEGLDRVRSAFPVLLIYFVVSVFLNLNREEERERGGMLLISAFITGTVLLNVVGLLEYSGVIGNRKYLILEPLNMHHIWYGNLNAVALYAGLGLFLFSSGKYKWLGFSSAFLALPCILFAQSRGVWLGVLLTVMASATLLSSRRKMAFSLLILILIALLFSFYFISDVFRERIDLARSDIALFYSGDADTSLGTRFLMWKAALRIFFANPLFGAGTGDYMVSVSKMIASGETPLFVGEYNQPHNMYLFLLAVNGIPGLFAYLFIYYAGFNISLRLLGGNKSFFGLTGFAVLFHYLFAGVFDLTNTQMMSYALALVMGSCLSKGEG